MASSNFSVPSPPLFSGENYQIWSIRMKSYLKAMSLWEVTENEVDPAPLPQNPTLPQIKKHEEDLARKPKALTCLHSAVSDVIFTRIMACESPKEAWDKLKEEFEGSTRVKAVKMLTLKREFEMLRMKDGESVKDYSSKLMQLVNQIRLFGEALKDSKVVEKILISLPAKFESKISAIEESCDLTNLSIAELISKLQAHEQRNSMRSEEAMEGVLVMQHKDKRREKQWRGKNPVGNAEEVQTKGKFPPCGTCRRTNHLEEDCFYKGKTQFQCRYCRKYGHIERYCKLKKEQMEKQTAEQANHIEDQLQPEEQLFMVAKTSQSFGTNTWLIDSGCTSHMSSNVSMFTSLDESFKIKVKLGNGDLVETEGIGTVTVHTKEGTKFISDVLYVPSLQQNLLSVAKMLKNGYSVVFKDNMCIITDPRGCEIANVEMVDDSFPLDFDLAKQHVYSAKLDETLLHYSQKSLKSMKDNDMVMDMSAIYVSDDVCGCCQQGKMHRKNFPINKAWRATNKLELVPTDICGPMSISNQDSESGGADDKVLDSSATSEEDDADHGEEDDSDLNSSRSDSSNVKTKSLSEIYARCNMVISEPIDFHVVQSTAEDEYVSAAAAAKQAIWLKKVQVEPTIIMCDNKSAIAEKKLKRTKEQVGGFKEKSQGGMLKL